MMKTVTATAGQTEVEREFFATPIVAVSDGRSAEGGLRLSLGIMDDGEDGDGLPVNLGTGRNMTREEAGELAAALLKLGADTTPVREVLRTADA